MTDPVLPDSLQAIADIVGAAAALKIAERWGGTRLYIPPEPGEDHPLSELIGIESARALGKAYDGERIEIPKADCWAQAMRNALILNDRASGKSQSKIAREHRLTERQIRNIERGHVDDDKQGALF